MRDIPGIAFCYRATVTSIGLGNRIEAISTYSLGRGYFVNPIRWVVSFVVGSYISSM